MRLIPAELAIQERTALLRSSFVWYMDSGGAELSDFLAKVQKESPHAFGEGWVEAEYEDTTHFPEDFAGQGLRKVVVARRPVIGYGSYVTRQQPAGTAAIHQKLAELGLPKEDLLFHALLNTGEELVIYRKIQGVDYTVVVEQGNWHAFTELGRSQQRYSRAGVLTHDNSIDDWMYDGTHALRIDLGAAEV
ncbi:MAG: hypothetical protein AABX37_03255, partial [Nanoarchaeota archaeon]